ncbi:MAG: 50S ribosomal protein L18 [Bacteroidetes bacterium]|nr:50S ribosomal protein L18 [Bacteroidota bacterium]MBU2584588.1 50S ribosomal protein L18 [Bacteroidota bacterium]
MINKKPKSRIRVKKKLKKTIKGTAEKPRLSVYRSLNDIYVQFIDDLENKTLFSISSISKDVKSKLADVKKKTDKSKIVGKVAAEVAVSKGISAGVFDRGGFRYHGRVKALADGLREGGLKF